MEISIGIGEARITNADYTISSESFTSNDLCDMSELIERIAPYHAVSSLQPALKRLSDLLWALTNDTDAFIVHMENSKNG